MRCVEIAMPPRLPAITECSLENCRRQTVVGHGEPAPSGATGKVNAPITIY